MPLGLIIFEGLPLNGWCESEPRLRLRGSEGRLDSFSANTEKLFAGFSFVDEVVDFSAVFTALGIAFNGCLFVPVP